MINPYLIIACLVAILGAGAGGFKLGADHEVAAQSREQNHIAEAIDAANNAAAQSIAKIKVNNTTIQNEVQREIQTQTIYNDATCRHTADGLRLVNKALTNSPAASDSKLP
jgi:hypothetical protein